MGHRQKTPPRPYTHSLSVELLEDRWLLSGLPSSANPPAQSPPPVAATAVTSEPHPPAIATDSAASSNGSVEVTELSVTEEDGGSQIPVSSSQLPMDIVAALDARFPGAEPGEVELSPHDGTPVDKVRPEIHNRPLAATLTRAGDISETEQVLSPGELPRPVLDWFRQNYPGGVIDEAKLVTKGGAVSYVVLIDTQGGEEVEATLRLQEAGTSRAPLRADEGVIDRPNLALTAAVNATILGLLGSVSASPITVLDEPAEPSAPGNPEAVQVATQAPVARVPAGDPSGPVRAESTQAVEQTGRPTQDQASDGGAEPPPEPAADVRPTVWVPLAAGAIGDRLPIDLATVEQALQRIGDVIDSLAEKVVGDTGATGFASRAAIFVAALVGARLAMLEWKKRAHEPVLASNAANSSWSWVLGTTTPKRP